MLELTPEQSKPMGLNKRAYEEALANFLGNYVWRAVHAFMDHEKFDASPIWISSKLGVTVEEAAEALDGLVLLGLAERTAKGFQPKQVQFLIPTEQMEPESVNNRHSLVSTQILSRLTTEQAYCHRLAFVAANKPLLRELNQKIAAAYTEFREKAENESKDGVYCLTFTGINILENNSNGGAL